jgi:hypothetical protein
MNYQLDISKEYQNARKKVTILSLAFSLIFSLILIADVLLVIFANEDYKLNLIIAIIISVLFTWGVIFFFPNFYNDTFQKYSFYKGYESGLKEIAEVEFDKEINEPINRDKNGLYLYPVHVTYIDGLNKTNKVIYTLEMNLGFKKGDKLTITTYQRVIIKAEPHL